MLDAAKIRNDFPILNRNSNGKPLIYLDSAATSLKPQAVINKITDYYTKYSANIFRGIYKISEEATAEYEEVRKKVAKLIGATNADEIVFTRNTSESINLVAAGIGKTLVSGDEIVTTIVEHHSNFVPWQQIAQMKSLEFRACGIDHDGNLDMKELEKLITRKTKVLTMTAVSNVLGTIYPVKEIVRAVKKLNPACLVLVDAAQAIPHMPIDVQEWGADFVAFSSHKMLGPTGTGVLWGKMEHLEALSPYQYGGEMISEVYVDKTIFKKPPHKFEAGTPHIAGVIGLGAAIDYLTRIGMKNIRAHEKEIIDYALKQLGCVKGLHVVGPDDSRKRGGVISFTLDGVHAHDIAQILDEDNICIRSGNHCAMPLHTYLHLSATARASFYVYTTKSDIDGLVNGLIKVRKFFC